MNKEYLRILQVFVVFSVLVIAGCYEPVPQPVLVGEEKAVVSGPLALPVGQYNVVGKSIEGWPLVAEVIGTGQDTTFILATIHGGERAGAPLVHKLAEHLERNPHLLSGRKVVLLPVANPDGMLAETRQNAKGVDLNRNFQAANRVNSAETGKAALSEPEAQAINTIIKEYSPDRIISIHAPAGCIDYDGPAYLLSQRISQYCNLPIKRLGTRPGSLGAYAGTTLNIPTITLELPASDVNKDPEKLWQQYGKALIAAITYPEIHE
jgi:protein MpaA